jgi:hypothetical protein
MYVHRSKVEPRRKNPTWEQRWGQPDKGLITCWDRGRELAEQDPQLAALAKAGELIPLSWKGGGIKPVKPNQRYGSFYYLAMWQGLRGDDLDIETEQGLQLMCARHRTVVTFTNNLKLLG